MPAAAAARARRAKPAIDRRQTSRHDCREGLNPMANNSWSKRFDEPIVLEDGTALHTLAQAIHYLADTVPKAEQKHER
jgi:hypothetical protein